MSVQMVLVTLSNKVSILTEILWKVSVFNIKVKESNYVDDRNHTPNTYTKFSEKVTFRTL